MQPSYSSRHETDWERRQRRRKAFKNTLAIIAIVADVVGVVMALRGKQYSATARVAGLTGRTAGRTRTLL